MVEHGKKIRVNMCLDRDAHEYLMDLKRRSQVALGSIVSNIVREHDLGTVDRLRERKRILLIEQNNIDKAIEAYLETSRPQVRGGEIEAKAEAMQVLQD